MTENLTQEEKEKILQEVFLDQAAELRQFKADDMVKKGVAKTFREAAEMIKADEIAKQELRSKNRTLSEQEKELMEAISSIRNNEG
ncbi:hypothetical protein HDR59_04515 [bacterium]|nr:hypothetical protein [bacterium]